MMRGLGLVMLAACGGPGRPSTAPITVLESAPPVDPDLAALGRTLSQAKSCVACHTIDGSPGVGPTWKGIWGTSVTSSDGATRVVDEQFVEESILRPRAFVLQGYPPSMPAFEGQLRPNQIAALITFIKSLK